MSSIYRAEVISSLIRPSYLSTARAAAAAGHIEPPEFKRVEDRAVDQAIALQEGTGVDVVSDGEMRRFSFFDHLLTAVTGVTERPGSGIRFHGERSEEDFDFRSPVTVVDRIHTKRMLTVDEFCYARARARFPLKVTLPSPLLLYSAWSPEHTRDAYSDPFELFADGVEIIRSEARELARLGCTYIQIDSPDLGTLADPENRALRESLGMPTERTLREGVDMINAVADVPGVTFGLHLCKGNYQSKWIATGGYDELADHIFRRATNFDTFLLEYDDERSGSFAPLAQIPDDKKVVLGLLSSKRPEVEPVDALLGRVEEAARYVDRERLALSTQCGFASVAPGANLIDEQVQEAKLRRVAEAAHEAWSR